MAVAHTRVRKQLRQLMAIMAVACVITPVFNVTASEASVRSAILAATRCGELALRGKDAHVIAWSLTESIAFTGGSA